MAFAPSASRTQRGGGVGAALTAWAHSFCFSFVALIVAGRANARRALAVRICDVRWICRGAGGSVAKAVRDALPVLNPVDQRARREAIANGVADNSKPEFRENVRRRTLALATGTGTANGVNVVLANWALDDVAAVV